MVRVLCSSSESMYRYIPCVAHTDAMINITERKLQQLIRQDTRGVRKAIQRMISKHRPQPHSPRMHNRLMTQTTETGMAMNNLDPLTDTDVSEDGEKGEDGWESSVAVDDPKGDVVDLDAVGEVADAFAVVVGVCDDDDFVTAVDEFARDLVDMGFDAAGLGKEEIADHGDVVCAARHGGGCETT